MTTVIQTAPGTGGLWFSTNPEGATIMIDDQEYLVKTPTAVNNIPPGSHIFTIKLEGYNDITDSADVVEARMCCIEYDMQSQQSTKTCNPTPIPETGPPSPPPQPARDYGMLAIGILVGITIALLIDKFKSKV